MVFLKTMFSWAISMQQLHSFQMLPSHWLWAFVTWPTLLICHYILIAYLFISFQFGFPVSRCNAQFKNGEAAGHSPEINSMSVSPMSSLELDLQDIVISLRTTQVSTSLSAPSPELARVSRSLLLVLSMRHGHVTCTSWVSVIVIPCA